MTAISSTVEPGHALPDLPVIHDDDTINAVVDKLLMYITAAIDLPVSWEELNSSNNHRKSLQPLIDYLSKEVHHPHIAAALLIASGRFGSIDDDHGINKSRGLACQLVASQFVQFLSDREGLGSLLADVPLRDDTVAYVGPQDEESYAAVGSLAKDNGVHQPDDEPTETTGLLSRGRVTTRVSSLGIAYNSSSGASDSKGADERPLNALEIAVVSECKKFLSQRCIQDIIDRIWWGTVVFFDNLDAHSVKMPAPYNQCRGDVWSRLRVPRYMKTYEIFFFLCLFDLFFTVATQRSVANVTVAEVLFYLVVTGFAIDEWNEYKEAGKRLYNSDMWNPCDLGIIIIGLAFFALRMAGLACHKPQLHEMAFSILALQSLFLTPRIFSLMCLHPYYGTLLPCLKEMGKQIIKFLGFVLIIYFGFFTTFVLLADGHVALRDTSITVLKVFFGGGVIGFDIAPKISPYLGLPVMIVFVCMTNQLLMTSMMAYVNTSLRQVLDASREEYLFVYSTYVLEASTSDEPAHFFPPFNLVPIVFLPLLKLLPPLAARRVRIALLKATHAPFVGIIWAYERWQDHRQGVKLARNRAIGIGAIAREMPHGKNGGLPSPPLRPGLSVRTTMAPASPVCASRMNPQVTRPQLGDGGGGAGKGRPAAGVAASSEQYVTLDREQLWVLMNELSAKVAELQAELQ